MKRFLPVTALTVTAAIALAGCSASAPKYQPTDRGVNCAPEGKASSSVKVTGRLGSAPGDNLKVDLPKNLKIDGQETSVDKRSGGKAVSEGDTVKPALTLYRVKDGKVLQHDPARELKLDGEQMPAWLGGAIGCATTHSRVVSVMPLSSIVDDASQVGVKGIKLSEPVVLVADLQPGFDRKKLLKKAEGKEVALPQGFPKVEVKRAKNGDPTLTIPQGETPPSKLSIAPVILGKGKTVSADAREVFVHYRGVIWRTGKEFDSSWRRGEPASFPPGGVIEGFKKALVGQKVGSQVIAVIPATDGGYGPEQLKQMGHEPNDVMVFVIDILGVH